MEKILFVDAGNSRLKWANLEEQSLSGLSELSGVIYDKKAPIEYYANLIETEFQNYNAVLLVSVQGEKFSDQAEMLTRKIGLDFYKITSMQQLGDFKNAYKTPEQLGADRFVAMLAAHQLADNRPCIVIDCGTAVTIDAIDASGQHLGGLILPGLQVSSNSLLKRTQQLHLDIKQNKKINLLSKNTSEAIHSGSFYGLIGAISDICSRIERQMRGNQDGQNVVKILCGGDAEVFLSQLPSDFEINTNLLMQGAKLIAEQYLGFFHRNGTKK